MTGVASPLGILLRAIINLCVCTRTAIIVCIIAQLQIEDGGGSDCYSNNNTATCCRLQRCTATKLLSAAPRHSTDGCRLTALSSSACARNICLQSAAVRRRRSVGFQHSRVVTVCRRSLRIFYLLPRRSNTRQPFSFFVYKLCICTIRPRGVVVPEARRALQRDAPAGDAVVEHSARSVRHPNPSVPACC